MRGGVKMSKQLSSQYIKWFIETENELSKFFKLFSPLCSECFLHTNSQSENGERKNRQFWCCCLIDNQIHDHWESLNTIQKRFSIQWYKKLNKDTVKKKRMPGNGPCPALGKSGCLIKKCRPVTCSTQVCEKMLYILNKAGIIKCDVNRPQQIEEIVDVPDILHILYGTKNRKVITEQDVFKYRNVLNQLKAKLSEIPKKTLTSLIKESLGVYPEKGGCKK